MITKDTYLSLERANDHWRMDGATFSQFMAHVSAYFKLSDNPNTLKYENIKYAEIAGDDLYVVSAIFGAYAPNDHKMILAPVNPGTFILPWLNYFTLNVVENSDAGDTQRMLLLESV